MTSSYCAPCIADLALVRDAVTSVAGTATCMAHAVLLTHSTDDPARRRQRLDALRDLAQGKAETAEPADQVRLELLVQEYGLAGAMDMGGPSRRQRGPGGQGGQHGGGQHGGQHGGGQQGGQHGGGQHGGPGLAGEERRPKSRRGRGRGEGAAGQGPAGQGPAGQGPAGQGGAGGPGAAGGESRRDRRANGEAETVPVTPAPGPAGEALPADAVPVTTSLADTPTTSSPSDVGVGSPDPAARPAVAPSADSADMPAGVPAGDGPAVDAPPHTAPPSDRVPAPQPASAPAPVAPAESGPAPSAGADAAPGGGAHDSGPVPQDAAPDA